MSVCSDKGSRSFPQRLQVYSSRKFYSSFLTLDNQLVYYCFVLTRAPSADEFQLRAVETHVAVWGLPRVG